MLSRTPCHAKWDSAPCQVGLHALLSGTPRHAKWDSMGGSDASATHQQHGQLARTGRRGAGGGVGQQRPQLVDDEMRQHAFRPRDLQRRPAALLDAVACRGRAQWRCASGSARSFFKRACGDRRARRSPAGGRAGGRADPLQRGVDGPRVRRPLGRAREQRVVPGRVRSVPARTWRQSRRGRGRPSPSRCSARKRQLVWLADHSKGAVSTHVARSPPAARYGIDASSRTSAAQRPVSSHWPWPRSHLARSQ